MRLPHLSTLLRRLVVAALAPGLVLGIYARRGVEFASPMQEVLRGVENIHNRNTSTEVRCDIFRWKPRGGLQEVALRRLTEEQPSNVWITLTTSGSERLEQLLKTLKSLNGTSFSVLLVLEQSQGTLLSAVPHTLYVAMMSLDYGPISRIAAVDVCFPKNFDGLFVTVDDDVIYRPHFIESVMSKRWSDIHSTFHPKKNFFVGTSACSAELSASGHGVCTVQIVSQRWEDGEITRELYTDEQWATMARCCDSICDEHETSPGNTICGETRRVGLLEQYSAVMFHRSTITSCLYEQHKRVDFPRYCFFADDFWLAMYAAQLNISLYAMRTTEPLISETLPHRSVGLTDGLLGNAENYGLCLRDFLQQTLEINC